MQKTQKNYITVGGNINPLIIISLLSACMIGFSIYLTSHYFEVVFPTTIGSGSLCNLNSFFNCDKATFSILSQIGGVPISIFGIIIGTLPLLALLFKSEEFEDTLYSVLSLNFLLCALLFFYSLFIMHGLCPFCFLYYVSSTLIWAYFFKQGHRLPIHIKINPAFKMVAIVAITFLIVRNQVNDKIKGQSAEAESVVEQYKALPNLGTSSFQSQYKIADNEQAPIKIVLFSDFECPACKAFSSILSQLKIKYGQKLDIQYFFYPLDSSCNPYTEANMHHHACIAAKIALCSSPAEFAELHDVFFKNQEQFDSGFLEKIIKDKNLSECIAADKTKNELARYAKEAVPFHLQSTPTFLLNGAKIEGFLPPNQLSAIFDYLLLSKQK